MKIICKVDTCNYHSNSDFCTKGLVFITPQGFCGRIYGPNGAMKQDWNTPIEQQEKDERIEEITDEDT